MLRLRSMAMAALLPEMREAPSKVRPSKAFPAGPLEILRYCREKRPAGVSLDVR